jgi:hypothetical protein
MDVELLDYSDFELPDEVFADIDHLNATGATIFTKELETPELNLNDPIAIKNRNRRKKDLRPRCIAFLGYFTRYY